VTKCHKKQYDQQTRMHLICKQNLNVLETKQRWNARK